MNDDNEHASVAAARLSFLADAGEAHLIAKLAHAMVQRSRETGFARQTYGKTTFLLWFERAARSWALEVWISGRVVTVRALAIATVVAAACGAPIAERLAVRERFRWHWTERDADPAV